MCLWYKALCSMDTVGEPKLEMEIHILPPDCHKAKPKESALQRGLARLPLLLFCSQVPQESLSDGPNKVQEQLAASCRHNLSPCSGKFHCGTLLIKENYPVISPSQVRRCCLGIRWLSGSACIAAISRTRKTNCMENMNKTYPVHSSKEKPLSQAKTILHMIDSLRHAPKQLISLKSNFLTGRRSENILGTKTNAILQQPFVLLGNLTGYFQLAS